MKKIVLLFFLFLVLVSGCKNHKTDESVSKSKQITFSLNKEIKPAILVERAGISYGSEYLSFITQAHSLLLYSFGEGKILSTIDENVVSAEFVDGGIFYVKKLFNPLKLNSLNYFNIKLEKKTELINTRERISLIESDGKRVAVIAGNRLKIFNRNDEVELREFRKDFSYNSGNNLHYFRASQGDIKSLAANGEIIWSDYKSGSLIYYVKDLGLMYADKKRNKTKIGEYFYPTLSSDGKYLIAISERYSNQQIKFSAVNLFVLDEHEWLKREEFPNKRYARWVQDKKQIIMIDKDNRIDIYDINEQEHNETN